MIVRYLGAAARLRGWVGGGPPFLVVLAPLLFCTARYTEAGYVVEDGEWCGRARLSGGRISPSNASWRRYAWMLCDAHASRSCRQQQAFPALS
jgi:hypothetical protein